MLCSQYLVGKVKELMESPTSLDSEAEETLLAEIDVVFTEEDNTVLKSPPSKAEVLSALRGLNFNSAAGTDGLPSVVYSVCWDSMGDSITDLIIALFAGPPSMRTALMVFGTKPGSCCH